MTCRDRQGNEIEIFDNPTGVFHFLYDCAAGKPFRQLLVNPVLSKCVGQLLNLRLSAALIRPFIKNAHIDMTEYESVRYRNFNEFFCRKIKKEARPIDQDPGHIISPCDCKLSVFPIKNDTRFNIKGLSYTMNDLLKDSDLANRYQDGTLILCRLTVSDLHRYCYIADGQESMRTMITGVLHTVNPFVAASVPIYAENNRVYSVLKTENAGSIIVMEIGAMMVGKIVNHPIRKRINRGEEKGYFQFGASSIILCFEKDRVEIDADLIRNSQEGCETTIKMGETIGKIK